jgi:ubiquinone/menaquinone biosynthesis C-methylase UbiE
MKIIKSREKISQEKRLYQGSQASKIFKGKGKAAIVRELYSESAACFSAIIRKKLKNRNKPYGMADFGCHKGELLQEVLKLLPGYNFHAIGIDLEKNLKENKIIREKIASDLTAIPLKNNSIDFGIMRYVLAWNTKKDQEKILKEILRITKDFVIIQHAGADNENPDDWRENSDNLFTGKDVPKLKRVGYFSSSRKEIEKYFKKNKIKFSRIFERKIDRLSNVFIERFALDKKDSEITRKILGDKDYIIQTNWVIYN